MQTNLEVRDELINYLKKNLELKIRREPYHKDFHREYFEIKLGTKQKFERDKKLDEYFKKKYAYFNEFKNIKHIPYKYLKKYMKIYLKQAFEEMLD